MGSGGLGVHDLCLGWGMVITPTRPAGVAVKDEKKGTSTRPRARQPRVAPQRRSPHTLDSGRHTEACSRAVISFLWADIKLIADALNND